MEKMITLEIPQSDWEKFKEELIRVAAVLKEQQRESEERRKRIVSGDARRQQVMAEIDRSLANVDKHLGYA
jgi:hypothetical protein